MADPDFRQICKFVYKDQAIWFLNGFWTELSTQANQVYEWFEHFIVLDKQQTPPKGEEGSELDKFWSAKFLEDKDSAMTLQARKAALAAIDVNQDGKMALLEYLAWKFNKTPAQVERAPQGSNQEQIEAAQRKMDEVMNAIKEVEASIEAIRIANAALLAAEEELKAAQAELNKQEEAYQSKKSELEKKSQEGSTVQKSKAANELAQLLAEDPLPLRKAKITNEAALRKVAKQTKEAHEAIEAGEVKKEQLEKKMDEAKQELDEAKKGGGAPFGKLYWMERQLFEADKSLARARQKYDHTKPFEFKSV